MIVSSIRFAVARGLASAFSESSMVRVKQLTIFRASSSDNPNWDNCAATDAR
jgi:hypothetical protein